MKTFSLLWSHILDSTLWSSGTKEDRLVWITLLAMKDKNGEVHASLPGLARRAIVTLEECQTAIKFLCSPDPLSHNKAEEGRRLVEIDGGWRIVSHDLYRFSTDAKRAFWAQQKRDQREKKKSRGRRRSKPVNGHLSHEAGTATERAFEKAFEDGDEAAMDKIVDATSQDAYERQTPPGCRDEPPQETPQDEPPEETTPLD